MAGSFWPTGCDKSCRTARVLRDDGCFGQGCSKAIASSASFASFQNILLMWWVWQGKPQVGGPDKKCCDVQLQAATSVSTTAQLQLQDHSYLEVEHKACAAHLPSSQPFFRHTRVESRSQADEQARGAEQLLGWDPWRVRKGELWANPKNALFTKLDP